MHFIELQKSIIPYKAGEKMKIWWSYERQIQTFITHKGWLSWIWSFFFFENQPGTGFNYEIYGKLKII